MTYDAVVSTERSHQFNDLPSGIRGFDDVTVDPSSRARDSAFVFAIDASSGLVCSCK